MLDSMLHLEARKMNMTNVDTIMLQHELRRSQFALDRCTNEKSKQMYRFYIQELATELLFRYRQAKLA